MMTLKLKTKRLLLFALAGFFLGPVLTVRAAEPLPPVKLAAWVQAFDTNDSLVRLALERKFSSQVPAGQQADALAQIVGAAREKNKVIVIESVLAYLSVQDVAMPWSADLDKALQSLAKEKNINIRAGVLYVYGLRPMTEKRTIVLNFLTDDNERIRRLALTSVRKWPDREAIYEKYITKNRGVAKRASTVNNATIFLSRSKKGQLK